MKKENGGNWDPNNIRLLLLASGFNVMIYSAYHFEMMYKEYMFLGICTINGVLALRLLAQEYFHE